MRRRESDLEFDDREPTRGYWVSPSKRAPFRALAAGGVVWVHFHGRTYRVEPEERRAAGAGGAQVSRRDEAIVRSPMPGVVLSVLVKKGDQVEADTLLFTIEAMKMEHEVRAGSPGRVARVHVAQGERVEKEAPLAEISA